MVLIKCLDHSYNKTQSLHQTFQFNSPKLANLTPVTTQRVSDLYLTQILTYKLQLYVNNIFLPHDTCTA